jgi:hypothetical protein
LLQGWLTINSKQDYQLHVMMIKNPVVWWNKHRVQRRVFSERSHAYSDGGSAEKSKRPSRNFWGEKGADESLVSCVGQGLSALGQLLPLSHVHFR